MSAHEVMLCALCGACIFGTGAAFGALLAVRAVARVMDADMTLEDEEQ